MAKKEQQWSAYENEFIMLLQLDKSRHSERIIIGLHQHMECYVRKNTLIHPILDITRPLGSLLFDIGEEDFDEWKSKILAPLSQAIEFGFHRKQAEATALVFLLDKMGATNPATKLAALQCAHFYQSYNSESRLSRKDQAGNYTHKSTFLMLSFTKSLWDHLGRYSIQTLFNNVAQTQERHRSREDSSLILWYDNETVKGEWVCITDSFYPALRYYLQRLLDWNICIRRCLVCGKPFLAPSNRYKLCSTACKKKRSQHHKQKFDANAKKNGHDIDYKNATQRMRNRLKKLRKSPVSDAELAQAEASFKSICKEACAQKKNIYSEYGHKAFQDWLFQQEREFEQICDSIRGQA